MDIYKLGVLVIPTNKPCIRDDTNDSVYKTQREKFKAVLEEIREIHQQGRPILAGTVSVDTSERLSKMLDRERIVHSVLNAKHNEQEAEIVARAGHRASVTIATNMAGRGTDIRLADGVPDLGGLHVLGTARHNARRIDRQLRGRCARQGDPGSYQFFLSLDDELLRCRETELLEQLREQARVGDQGTLALSWLTFFRKTQKMLERQHREPRRELLKHEKQRNDNYRRMGLDPCLELTES